MGVYFLEKSLSFLSPVLIDDFKILKLPQNFSPKVYLKKTKKNLQKVKKKNKKSKIMNKKQEKIAYFRGNFAKNCIILVKIWPKLMYCLPNP